MHIINAIILYGLDSYESKLNYIFSLVRHSFQHLTNHSYLAIIISDDVSDKWQLIADITIFAEKFIEHKVNKAYFRWKKVQEDTESYIQQIDSEAARFDLCNEGFTYKDCYVTFSPEGSESCVVLFEKNERDETPIPCPKCRSHEVQGNSYPVLGVRSWECKNTFCGDKSKYNRGKRYSLTSIIRQKAILDNNNIISKDLLRKWRRDIVENIKAGEILEFLIKLYSLHGDTVTYFGDDVEAGTKFGRRLVVHSGPIDVNASEAQQYKSLHFFSEIYSRERGFC